MNIQNDFFDNNQNKEINFNNISKINVSQNIELQKNLHNVQNLHINNNNNLNKQNLINQIKNDNLNNSELLLLKFNKLKYSMNNYSNILNNNEKINNFKRKILIDYSNNITFILPYKPKENTILCENKSLDNIIQKEILQNNLKLGNKKNREISKLEYEQYNKSNEESKSIAISQNKVIEYKTFENDKLKDGNDNIKFNYKNFTLIKKLLIELNFKINKEYNKVYKKYFFYLSKILFIITINNNEHKVTEILEKKGNKEIKLNTEKYITKELSYIKMYLEKRKSIL